ncbi:MAG TPA: gliding motility protein GldC [Flavobacteriales bacterium]|jgi:gliding motility-associated protein GldC|nr:gliding motility protein GldC [Flavobacteriales bacterium]
MKKSEIKIELEMDENAVPERITWHASDAGQKGDVKASFLSVWDDQTQTALRVDLWTKEMTVDEMKLFFYQTLMTMADSFEKATGMNIESDEIRDFGTYFGRRVGLISQDEMNRNN